MGNEIDNLTTKQELAIVALLRESTVANAALACEASERTIYRWFQDPEFAKAYRRARREAFGHAVALTQRYAPLAVNTLASVMSDKNAPPHARVTAASNILKFGREGIELDDLAARVEALEQATEQREKAGRNHWTL